MQKIMITCNNNEKKQILNILKVNRYQAKEYHHQDEILMMIEVYGYQVNLLLEILKSNKIEAYMLNAITYY